jgi:hypothetical protein
MGHTFQHYLNSADAFKGKSAAFDPKVLRLLADWFKQQEKQAAPGSAPQESRN